MNTLTIKLPESLDNALAAVSARENLSKSEVVRRAVASYIEHAQPSSRKPSALALAGDLVGCFAGGPPDLASNPRHLDGFGRN